MNKYYMRSDTILDDEGVSHTVYGIELPNKNISIKNIFINRKEAEDFVKLCNDLDLSYIHLEDVIQDVL